MEKHYQILIIGAGNAGISVAAQLKNKDKTLSIGIIDPSEKHFYQPAWTLVGAGVYDLQKTVRNQKDQIPKGVDWLKESANIFLPEKNQVTTLEGNIYNYDYLVVAPGIQLDWNSTPGLLETLGKNEVSSNYKFELTEYNWDLIKNFKGGTAVFVNPSTPIKCGGAPHKIMYLACDYWSKNGILDKTDVHYISGGTVIFGVPEYKVELEKVLIKYKIKPHYLSKVKSINGLEKKIVYEQKGLQEEITNHEIVFDICHFVPNQSAPDFIKHSPIADPQNPYGFVQSNKETMQHPTYPNIFSLGDVSAAPFSKTGSAIRKQAPVVTYNILQMMQNKSDFKKYDGYSACPIPVANGKLIMAEFDYTNKPSMTFPFDQSKPSRLMWIFKRYILPWLYWNKILKGKA